MLEHAGELEVQTGVEEVATISSHISSGRCNFSKIISTKVTPPFLLGEIFRGKDIVLITISISTGVQIRIIGEVVSQSSIKLKALEQA
jgi:hypothetical protein